MRFSGYIFFPPALASNNLKLHQTGAIKKTFTQEKLDTLIIFNPRLALISFRNNPAQVYKWVPVNARAILQYNGLASRPGGSRNTCSHFIIRNSNKLWSDVQTTWIIYRLYLTYHLETRSRKTLKRRMKNNYK